MLFVVVPLLELGLLVAIGGRVGLVPTVALVVVTGILGATLARRQGLATLDRLRETIGEGRVPHQELVDGALILVAAAFLLTPGLITDSVGFALLVPPVRAALRRRVAAWVGRRFVVAPPERGPLWRDDVIDVDAVPDEP